MKRTLCGHVSNEVFVVGARGGDEVILQNVIGREKVGFLIAVDKVCLWSGQFEMVLQGQNGTDEHAQGRYQSDDLHEAPEGK